MVSLKSHILSFSIVLLSVLFLGVYSPVHAIGKNYYVSTTGSDTAGGLTGAPFKTIGKAVSIAQPGDVIYINAGTYKENVKINSINGSPGNPITIIGVPTDQAQYPVIDGGDAGYASTSDNPAFKITNSSWLSFERLKIINSSRASYQIEKSSYIVIRRNIIDYHKYAILSSNSQDSASQASHHILIELNEIYQSYGRDKKWSEIKASKWEGGAYTSFGGGGMVEFRNNYVHDSFNGVYVYRNETRRFTFADANVWIHDNRFEWILDDPFEPDVSYSYNSHFYNNILYNTHRMVSLAASSSIPGTNGGIEPNLGPIYVYNNAQYTGVDVTNEGTNDRLNSMLKVALSNKINYFDNGVYVFNNSVDLGDVVNGYGLALVNESNGGNNVNKLFFYNNALRTKLATVANISVTNSEFSNNFGSGSIPVTNPNGAQNTNPSFSGSSQENFALSSSSPAKGKSRAISFNAGFESSQIIQANADVGVQMNGSCFVPLPLPKYQVPPGGDIFTQTYPWPADTFKGNDPRYMPNGCNGNTKPYPTSPVNPTTLPSLPQTTTGCTLHPYGDADCNNVIESNDYTIWRNEFVQPRQDIRPDFNNDKKTSLIDLEIWTRSISKGLAITPTAVPTVVSKKCWGINGECDTSCTAATSTTTSVFGSCSTQKSCPGATWKRPNGQACQPSGIQGDYRTIVRADKEACAVWSDGACNNKAYTNRNCTKSGDWENKESYCSADGTGTCFFLSNPTYLNAIFQKNSYNSCYASQSCGSGTGPCIENYQTVEECSFGPCTSSITTANPKTVYTTSGTCSTTGAGTCYKVSTPATFYSNSSTTSCTPISASEQATKCTWLP